MANIRDYQTRWRNRPGKIVGPREIWKEPEGGYKRFKIEELFKSSNGDADIQKIHINGKGNNVVSAGESNNGVIGRTDLPAKVFHANTITIDMFGNAYYQVLPYKMVTHARVFSLSPTGIMRINEKIGLYVIASFQYFKHLFSYDNMCSWEKIRKLTILLPMEKNGTIDFEFIEKRINVLNKERMHEFETYLQYMGFNDCTLTKDESDALCNYKNVIMKEYTIGALFEIHKGKRLTKADMTPGNTNFIGATADNNGITNKISNATHIHPSNTITITYNGSVGEAFYQTDPFWASDDVNVLYPKEGINLDENIALYFLAPIRKKGKKYAYSFKWTKEKMEKDSIWIPCKIVNGETICDYSFMENYINAIKKHCIARLKKEFEIELTGYKQVGSNYNIIESQLQEKNASSSTVPVYDEYRNGCVPLYTLRVACGEHKDGVLPEQEGWVDASGNGFTPDPRRHFVVHAKGNSMLPKIKDGDLCVFEWYKGGSRDEEIVLNMLRDYDPDFGGPYTIKKYQSEKIVTDESWIHTKVELIPLNKDFDVIELDSENEYRTIGVFKCVL